jgi:hypothetical protein
VSASLWARRPRRDSRVESVSTGSVCTTALTLLTGGNVASPSLRTLARADRQLSRFNGARSFRHADAPSGGRVEVLRRGTRGMDAERGTMGQGRPIVTPPGAAPERGESRAARPGCRGVFLCLTFFAQAKKVGRPAGRNPAFRLQAYPADGDLAGLMHCGWSLRSGCLPACRVNVKPSIGAFVRSRYRFERLSHDGLGNWQ